MFCFKSVRDEKHTEFVGEKTHVHNPDVRGPDGLAGQEAPEEPGILGQAGRERQGPRSRQRRRERQGPWRRQGEQVARLQPWQSHKDVMTAGPHDGAFPTFRTFSFYKRISEQPAAFGLHPLSHTHTL